MVKTVRVANTKLARGKPVKPPIEPPPVEPEPTPPDNVSGTFKGTVDIDGGEVGKAVEGTFHGICDPDTGEFDIMGILVKSTVGASVPVISVAPVVSPSSASVGASLSCTTGTWLNSPSSYAYQWKRGVTNIGTDSSSYTTVSGDAGFNITCEVTATNGVGASVPSASNACAVTAAGVPAITSAPTLDITTAAGVTGSLATGATVTCSTGSWSGSPTSYEYQWVRGAIDIANPATKGLAARVTTSADNPSILTCRVRATNANGPSAWVTTSNSCNVNSGAVPTNSVPPTLSATTAVIDDILFCAKGTWTAGANLPTGFNYQWMRNGVDIAGATSGRYKVVAADDGTTLTCKARAYNDSGNALSYITTSNSCVVDQPTASVANQTIDFGGATLASAGGAKAIDNNGQEIDFISLDSVVSGVGTGWGITAGRLVRSSAPSGSHGAVLRCTTTLGQRDFTINSTTGALNNGYSVRSSAELSALVTAVPVATLSGQTIFCRTGVYIDVTIASKTYTSDVNVTKHAGAFPIFEGIVLYRVKHWKMTYIEFFQDIGVVDNFVNIYGGPATCDDITIDHCTLHARYHDPSVRWGGLYKHNPDSDYIVNVQNVKSIIAEDCINLTMSNNTFFDLAYASITQTEAGGTHIFDSNLAYSVSADVANWTGIGTVATAYEFTNNRVKDFFWGSPSSHNDVFQYVGSGIADDFTVTITGNRCAQTINTDVSQFQGVLLGNMHPSASMMGLIEQNLWAGGQAINVRVEFCKNLTVRKNTVVRNSNFPIAPNINLSGDNGGNVVEYNVSEFLFLFGAEYGAAGAVTVGTNNRVIGYSGGVPTPGQYAACFDGIAGNFYPATLEEAELMFKRKTSGPLDVGIGIGCDL